MWEARGLGLSIGGMGQLCALYTYPAWKSAMATLLALAEWREGQIITVGG